MGAITRQEALKNGETTYDTGKSCVNGHTSYRYASSGACAACVKSAAKASLAPLNAALAVAKAAKAEQRDRITDLLPEHRLRAYPEDVAALQRMADAICAGVLPDVPAAEFRSRRDPIKPAGGTAFYSFRYPLEYAQTMLTLSNSYLQARSTFDPAQVRGEAVRRAQEVAAENRPPPAEWAFV